MMTNEKNEKIKTVKECVLIIVAAILGAVAIHVFSNHAQFAPIGFDGIATMLSETTKLSFYLWSLILNLPLIVLGYFFLKKKYIFYTLLYILLNALFVFTLEHVECPFLDPAITLNEFQMLDTGIRVIAAIFTGILLGLRTGIMLKIGASSGGIDIPACMIARKFKGRNIEIFITAISFVIIAISYFIYKDFLSVLLSIIEMAILTIFAGIAQKDLRNALEFKIVTKHSEEVKELILKNYRHGCTVLKSKGGFTDSESATILTVINIRELSGFLARLSKIPDTFAYYSEVTGLLGNFRWRREDVAK